MRRGELLGLRWADVDLDRRQVRVAQTRTMVGDRPQVGTPKSSASRRRVSVDEGTVRALRAWGKAQAVERLRRGRGWQGDHDLVTRNH